MADSDIYSKQIEYQKATVRIVLAGVDHKRNSTRRQVKVISRINHLYRLS